MLNMKKSSFNCTIFLNKKYCDVTSSLYRSVMQLQTIKIESPLETKTKRCGV